ncbi:ATP-dependent helicase [Aeromicrobium sp. YIM 150415]|uniref:ATP-dependent helicase n=1 Tax=Aeromicrobium sp. YIM 150415 TaxID=2803912 RepID=UPI0019662BAB|nr:ATP-dependent helicase [Aeromicrobium sp. YIM 150415]MBM9463138.1 ATP-dependent helicase [Aeromicrobium sp. YIM 150415]
MTEAGLQHLGFTPATQEWFADSFAAPTPAQRGAWEAIGAGQHTLVVAPTGSGKTLAAFLSAIDRLLRPRPDDAPAGVRVLYISPLKALAVDVERNLRSPLVGISNTAVRRGEPFREVTVGLRSGDTPPSERRRLQSHPPDVLITTPESLFLMLTASVRETLRTVEVVIVDEIHAVAGSKRGAHLALSLERLDSLLERPAQRIGLSATVRPHDEVARFLGGQSPVRLVAPASPSRLELDIVVPVEDMTEIAPRHETGPPEGSAAQSLLDPEADRQAGNTIWPHVEEAVVDRVLEARSTIVFANSRGVAERLTARLNEVYVERIEGERIEPETRSPARMGGLSGQSDGAPPAFARAHHGSVSKEQRALIEDDLKSGRLRCVVATSSLELGIDMGAVDLVIQVSSPPSVAAGLQRVGRAGHQVGEVSRGSVFPTNRHDLLAGAVTAERMREGAIERLRVLANPLDLLAQQTIAATALEPLDVEEWFDIVRRSAPFAALPRSAFDATLDLISGRYPSDEFGELRPRVVWDRDAGTLTARPGAQRLAVTSGGTIPDRGMFSVVLAGEDDRGGRKVGELDEEMVYESRVNDVVALGATSWRIQEITHDRVIVTPAFGLPARLPFWRGDAVGRPYELGAAIGAFLRRLESGSGAVDAGLGLDDNARGNLNELVAAQREATGRVPTDTTLVVERFRDELGDWRVVLLSPYGRSVHAPWALAVGARIQEQYGIDGSVVAGDDGIVARVPDTDAEPPGTELFVFEPDDLERIVTEEVGGSALFASRFRECAARALLLPRRNPGARAPLWQQRQRSAQLLDVARKHPTFPILLETAREVLQDVYDLPALTGLARSIQSREVAVVDVITERASPFAQTQLFGYVGAFLYDGDLPLAERRAAALSLDPDLLAELLGRTDLRELLDPEVVATTERELQRLVPERAARSLEHVADLVRTIGPLSAEEITARTDIEHRGEVSDWLSSLRDQRRLIEVPIAGEPRWAAVEDAARLRDALGTALPMGIAAAHLESPEDPLGDLVARYARTHGPFTAEGVAGRYGLGRAVAETALARLAEHRRVVAGEFDPTASGREEWVNAEILRRLRARSLAAARHQVEPVDRQTFARFLPAWQQVGSRHRGPDALLAAIDQLAGVPIPASAWETLVLPQRVADYQPPMLDELLASGEVWWSGAGTLAGNDGWVRIFPADVDPVAEPAADAPAADSMAGRLLSAMRGSGAFLFGQLHDLVDTSEDESLVDALWQLTWSGAVSNDTFAPIRALLRGGGAHRGQRPPPRARLHRGRRVRPTRPVLPPVAAGRWFALEPSAESTQAALLRTELALGRHGIITKGAVAAEQQPGGFAAMYRVLRELEQSGGALRGYFVDGLGGAQFAANGAIDRLRSLQRDDDEPSDDDAVVLAATDPANPYGAALPWPERELGHRPGRKAGSIVVLHDGALVFFLERGGKTMLTFTDDPERLERAAQSFVATARRLRLGRFTVQTADGEPVASTPAGGALAAAGFEAHLKGLRFDA